MYTVNWLKMGYFEQTFKFLERKKVAQGKIWKVYTMFEQSYLFFSWKLTCLHLNSWGSFLHTLFACSNLLLKFVWSYFCPYSTPLPIFWCLNDNLFSQQSSPFPYLHQFSLFLDSEVICYLPHPSFWKTSCAIPTH